MGIKEFTKNKKEQLSITKNEIKSKLKKLNTNSKLKLKNDIKLKNVNESSDLKNTKENTISAEPKENVKLNDVKENLELNIPETKEPEKIVESKELSKETTKQDKESKKVESPEEIANKRIEKKKELYKRLCDKEYEYANVVLRMLKSFRKPLIDDANSENPSIKMSQIETLFDGFDDILNLSWSLCGELKLISNLYKQLKPVNIGDVFLKHAKDFDVYSKYCSRFVTANELLRELNANTKFRKYQYALLESTTLLKNDDYREVLKLPIYHIEEYYNILKKLLNSTPKYDPSYEMLEDSYEFIDELYLQLKEALKKENKVDEILEIRKNIVDCPRSIVKPGRYLYRDFQNLLELPTQRPFRLVIFSDILLLARWDKKSKRFVYHRAINYKALKVVDNVSKSDHSLFALLLLNPFSKKNFDLPQQNNNTPGNNASPRKLSDRSDSFSRTFSRLFSWSFNQNITRIDLKAPNAEIQGQIVGAINKRISELNPPPFELLWPDPKDVFDNDVVKGIRNPVAADPKEILLNSHICNSLYHAFPKRLRIKRSLTLLYSLQNHGSSLSTFYERSNAGYGTAQVLVIKDDNDNIFGCFTAEPFRINNGFYGTGESFLFKVQKPKLSHSITHTFTNRANFGLNRNTLGRAGINRGIVRNRSKENALSNNNNESEKLTVKVYPWAKTNYLFINSTHEYVAVGSGKGKYGIYCDNNFQRGSSYPTETFHNDALSGTEHFNIVNVELWTFTSQIEREFRRKRQTKFPTKFQK